MSASHTLLGASDLLSIASSLMEAVWMAAAAISDQEQTDAIQQVCQAAQKHLADANAIIEAAHKASRA